MTEKYYVTSAIVIGASLTILTSGAYAILIPALGINYKTPYILAAGVTASALTNGCLGYRAAANETLPIKIGLCFLYVAITSTLVFSISLFLILKIRGV